MTTNPQVEVSQADIVLVSQDRSGEPGYQLHGLFYSFADAARHVAKDQALTVKQTAALVEGWSGDADRYESAEVGAWWVAARQSIRSAPLATSTPPEQVVQEPVAKASERLKYIAAYLDVHATKFPIPGHVRKDAAFLRTVASPPKVLDREADIRWIVRSAVAAWHTGHQSAKDFENDLADAIIALASSK